MDEAHRNEAMTRFSEVTGSSPHDARSALEASGWDVSLALTHHFSEEHESDRDDGTSEQTESEAVVIEPSQNSRGSTSKVVAKERGPVTLNDLRSRIDDAEEKGNGKQQDMFAGGEKSGLAVQNPSSGGSRRPDHFENIMRQARADRPRPELGDNGPEPARLDHFQGRAQTLGGDDVESRVIEDPRVVLRPSQRLPRVTRSLHLWADGFSVDDGPLYRFDDPANQSILAQINQGSAPLDLLDVQPGQEVDLNLVPHKDENYVAPKKVYKPFGGQGQRLGSPSPSAGTAEGSPASLGSSVNADGHLRASTADNAVVIDETAPTIVLQIRLGNGSRLQSRFNTTHTLDDVYHFVDRSGANNPQRPYVLMTTFPAKELSERKQALSDIDGFQRGGTVVQRWT